MMMMRPPIACLIFAATLFELGCLEVFKTGKYVSTTTSLQQQQQNSSFSRHPTTTTTNSTIVPPTTTTTTLSSQAATLRRSRALINPAIIINNDTTTTTTSSRSPPPPPPSQPPQSDDFKELEEEIQKQQEEIQKLKDTIQNKRASYGTNIENLMKLVSQLSSSSSPNNDVTPTSGLRTASDTVSMATATKTTDSSTSKASDSVNSHATTPITPARNEGITKIPTNPDATMAKDLVSIHHNAQYSKLVVKLKANGRCPRPYLIGRLSGPVLVKIQEWTWSNQTNSTTTVLEGRYQVPVGGHYFLEIVAIFCNDFFYDLNQRSKKEKLQLEAAETTTLHDWTANTSPVADLLGFDFSRTCVENPSNHRLTAKDASIWVEENKVLPNNNPHPWSQQHKQHPWAGFWWHKNWTAGQSSFTPPTMSRPVYTRHQLPQCYYAARNKQPAPPECSITESISHFDDYEFRWWQNSCSSAGDDTTNKGGNLGVSMLKQSKPTVICMVGASHARKFVRAAERMGINSTTSNITFDHANVGYPIRVGQYSVLKAIKTKGEWHPNSCNKVVIGVGQWPASFDQHRPWLLDEYYRSLKAMLKTIREDDDTKDMDVYMRSIHYNPLGFKHSKCGPADWRNPAVIDAYNVIIERVCQELNIPFLDTRHIDGHVWDSAKDWNHLQPAPEEADLLYLTAAVLGISPADKKVAFK